jgi:hypothetical protein
MPGVIIAPELLPPWALRTEIPTVVADLCEDACDLAVWRAIRWLIALSGRDRLGVDARTIAAHAKVDVKTALRCINGDRPESAAKRRPRSLKRGLVGLGLLEVVGSQAVGKLKPRPVYRIPRWIEERNAEHTRELLARLGMEPPAPTPPPGQAALPLDLDPDSEQARAQMGVPGDEGAAHEAITAAPVPFLDQAGSAQRAITDPDADQAEGSVPLLDQGVGAAAPVRQKAEAARSAPTVPDPHVDQRDARAAAAADPNPACWMEGTKEGGREGRDSSPTRPMIVPAGQEPPSAAAEAAPAPVIVPGERRGMSERPVTPHVVSSMPPPAPPGELFAVHPGWVAGALPAHPLDLWRRACAARRPIDDDQLAILASEHDAATGGHGWYWVGRAILAAAVAEDIHSVAKVRRTLERWRAEGAYGSDAPAGRRPVLAPPPERAEAAPRPGQPRAEPRQRRAPLSERMGLTDIFQEV